MCKDDAIYKTSVVCFVVHKVDLPRLATTIVLNALHFVYVIEQTLTQIHTWDEGISSDFCVNVVIH